MEKLSKLTAFHSYISAFSPSSYTEAFKVTSFTTSEHMQAL